MEILEGPEWEQAESLAGVPPEHWDSWLLSNYGRKRGEQLKFTARYLLDNIRVLEDANPLNWLGIGCESFDEVLTYFDLTAEQWNYLKAGESVLFPGEAVVEKDIVERKTPPDVLRLVWSRASAQERSEFLKSVQAEGDCHQQPANQRRRRYR